MKTALVLEGGGLRGIYTAGVLDILLDNNIEVDAIFGVSAGALFGINYVSKQRGRVLEYNLKYCKDKNYMGFHSLLKTGNIMNEEFCFDKLVYELNPFDFKTFSESNTKFYATVTNLETGAAEYHQIKDYEEDREYLRASGSLPLVSKIVYKDNTPYLDGAIGDSIPVEYVKSLGYEKIIIVLTRPIDYRKKKSASLPYKIKYKKYPNFIKSCINRYKNYNNTVEKIIELENKEEIFVIRPTKHIKISRLEHNPVIIKEMYDLGVTDTNDKIETLKEYLNK